jgi:hypothetical protein
MKPISEGKGSGRGPKDATRLLAKIVDEICRWRGEPLNMERMQAIVDVMVLLVEWNAINFDAPAIAAGQQEATHGKDA